MASKKLSPTTKAVRTLRENLNSARKVDAGEIEDPRLIKELQATHAAAKRAARAGMSHGTALRLAELEARAMGGFTQRLGKAILRSGISPLEFLVREMRDPSNDKKLRVDCAVASLPYIHAKLPQETRIEVEPGTRQVNVFNVQQTQLQGLSDEELDALSRIAEKLLPPPIDVEHTRD